MASWFLRLPVPANPSSGNGNLRTEGRKIMRQVENLDNHQLSDICKVYNAKSTGTNVELQHRIQCLIQDAVNASDRSGLQKIHQSMKKTKGNRQRGSSFPQSNFPEPSDYSPGYNLLFRACHGVFPDDQHSGADCRTSQLKTLTFKPSPFYQMEASISDVQICDVTSGRHTISSSVTLEDGSSLRHCIDNPSYRVLIVCAGDCVGIQDVAFPQSSQLKINGQAFPADFLGLKNKPGSVRPIDITDVLCLRPNYTNTVEFTYGPTKRVFYFRILVRKKVSVKDLVKEIHKRPLIDSAKQGYVHCHKCDWGSPAAARAANTYNASMLPLIYSCKHKVRNGNAPSAGSPHLLRSWRSISPNTTVWNVQMVTYCNDTDPVTSDIKPISHGRATKAKAATPTNNMASHDQSSPRHKRCKGPVVDLTFSDDEDAPPPTKRRNTSGNL
ncbi:hypothetical protein FOXB_01014 [Fusarium oxysporum f. sp. conglutinans Fo5176]|uniref:PINIT domain-containing protein n=1 Tax=Fusarium oxysporum (strain Fo5176) TaxID=660025 RepID=F9F3N9_FUSOF|nr:hypothetical protein FOXB_01014 [Fusarium oxysporum f. sp. conglutinans Fo5176]